MPDGMSSPPAVTTSNGLTASQVCGIVVTGFVWRTRGGMGLRLEQHGVGGRNTPFGSSAATNPDGQLRLMRSVKLTLGANGHWWQFVVGIVATAAPSWTGRE